MDMCQAFHNKYPSVEQQWIKGDTYFTQEQIAQSIDDVNW